MWKRITKSSMGLKLFINEFINDKNVGAVAPTSNHLTQKIITKINFENVSTIVEYGPGNGVITRILLDKMKPDAMLYVFETNNIFFNNLSEIKDKRLVIINDDAENAKNILKNSYQIEKVDYIISTIPFTFIEKRKRKRIIYKSFVLLNEKGMFITYQYSWLIFNLIKKQFKKAQWKLVLLNLPPVFIIEGIK
ncbi:MAG: SAM-dependent methyltransferase [Bacteroidetes bacterium CG_4_8_14_3_um_filter_31_14]|nr:MAG: SAM-dependent methyltransferase [Bacteroidetes bacterium CG_4_8_14_3_um_filter_31_14]